MRLVGALEHSRYGVRDIVDAWAAQSLLIGAFGDSYTPQGIFL